MFSFVSPSGAWPRCVIVPPRRQPGDMSTQKCSLPVPNKSLNVLVFVFVSGAVSLSHVDVALNVLDLSVVDILLKLPDMYPVRF